MAAPVEVGTQGTVASLVCREIEYFKKLEASVGGHVSCHGKKKKSSSKVAAASGGSPTAKKPKKKSATGGMILPRMCSSAEVMEGGGRKERPARVLYRHLGEEDDYDSLPHRE